VRVINVALNVVELAGSVFQYADLEAVLAHLAKEGASTTAMYYFSLLSCSKL
jgi:protein transport protein SEC24